jgi:hypothetical protein
MHNSLKIIKAFIIFLFRSMCFGYSCAHHQEPPNSAHTASSHRVSLGWLYLLALVCHYFRDSLSLLEPSGPVQACNGIPLSFNSSI